MPSTRALALALATLGLPALAAADETAPLTAAPAGAAVAPAAEPARGAAQAERALEAAAALAEQALETAAAQVEAAAAQAEATAAAQATADCAGDCACARAKRRDEDHDNGGYGGFHRGFSALGDQLISTSGGRGGWVIDHRWVVGGYGFHGGDSGKGGDHHHAARASQTRADRIDVGGLFVERVLWPGATAHPTVELAVGSGRVAVDGDGYAVLHGGAAARLELRAASWARVAFGPRIDLAVLPTAPPGVLLPHSSVGADVLFKFGWF
jgi:hypothetical protein